VPREVDVNTTFCMQRNYDMAKRMMLRTREALDSAGIRWWLEGGCLLGCQREHDLIPHDDDLDIAIDYESDWHKVASALTQAGCHLLFKDYFYQGVRYGLTFGAEHSRRGEPWDVHMDVWRLVPDNGRLVLPTVKGPWIDGKPKYTKMLFPMVEEIIRTPFLGADFPIPANWDEYLRAPYGDWRVVDKNYLYLDSSNYE
jgi:hypothetical protein